jgi:hypothetical protein
VQNQSLSLYKKEPEPDVAIVRGRLEDYSDRHPGPADVWLVIEVADTTLVTDRFKAQLYAEAGIPVYWIVNLLERVVEVYQDPSSGTDPPRYESVSDTLPATKFPSICKQIVGHCQSMTFSLKTVQFAWGSSSSGRTDLHFLSLLIGGTPVAAADRIRTDSWKTLITGSHWSIRFSMSRHQRMVEQFSCLSLTATGCELLPLGTSSTSRMASMFPARPVIGSRVQRWLPGT